VTLRPVSWQNWRQTAISVKYISAAEALGENGPLAIGKTFAYLAPILLANGKAIISTGTKQLQDQLFHKDLPALEKAISMDLECVMLKGRANYLCLHRLRQAKQSMANNAHESFIQIKAIDAWSTDTGTGDIAEFKILPEDHRVWPSVTSTVDNCIGQECSDYSKCFVVKARQAAHGDQSPFVLCGSDLA